MLTNVIYFILISVTYKYFLFYISIKNSDGELFFILKTAKNSYKCRHCNTTKKCRFYRCRTPG